MAFRLPKDLAASIRGQAVNGATITDVVIRMLRTVKLDYTEFPAKKMSKKVQAAEARKASDPVAQNLGRTDIDYMNPDELPSAGSVGDAIQTDIWRAGRDFNRPPHVSTVDQVVSRY